MKYIGCLLLAVAVFSNGVVVAFETDQYNLPPQPLADIGAEVVEHIAENIRSAIDDVNRTIAERKSCVRGISRVKSCGSTDRERAKLAELLSDDAIQRAVYERLAGRDLMTTRFGKWMARHKFAGQPDRFWTDYSESIYLLNPANYATISPTVRIYGVEFGIDKLEHLLQQGHQYYEIEQEALAKGLPAIEAEKKAVEWGRKTERTYYGLLTSGVYSNADLFANYAGLRFYQNLTRRVKVGDATLPPIVMRDGDAWKMNAERPPSTMLKPFISEHLNEALNPSAFRITLVRSVRRAIRRNACPDWLAAHPDLTAATVEAKRKALETWQGEDYGWTEKSRIVTIANVCF